MQFTAEQYYRAAQERIVQARKLYEREYGYSLTMYCAGLAVECLLRAFRWVEDNSFEGRHDMRELLKASKLLQVDADFMRLRGETEAAITESAGTLKTAMYEVILLWHNNLRFADEASLKAHLRKIDRLKGIKGNALRKNAWDLINASQTVINRGMVLWASKKK